MPVLSIGEVNVKTSDAQSMGQLGNHKSHTFSSCSVIKTSSKKIALEKENYSGGENIVNNQKNSFLRNCQICIERENKFFFQDCQDGLVKSSLYFADNLGLGIHDLISKIDNLTGLKDFPIQTLKHTIARLFKKRSLFEQYGKYFLKKPQSKLLKETLAERKTMLTKVESDLVARMKEETEVDFNSSKIALDVLYEFLRKFIENGCRFAVNTFFSDKMSELPRSSQDTLINILEKVEDTRLRQTIQNSIIETLQAQRKSFAKLLNIIATNYVGLEILKVDPDGEKWKKATLSNKSFLLDTNVLFALVLTDHPKYILTNEIVSILRDFKINLMFTERTLQEWLEVLEKANQRFKFINSIRPSLLEKMEDIFICSYFEEKENNPLVAWQEYYSRMTQIGLLARKKNVNIFDKETCSLNDLKSQTLLDILSNNVHRSARRRLNDKFTKSRQVSEHDAYHLLIIRKLREKYPLEKIGPSFWFLTYDNSLIEADDGLNKMLGSPLTLPSSLIADFIFPLVLPFVDSPDKYNKLADIFMNLMIMNLVTVPNGLSASKIVEILSPWLSYKSLSDEDLENILKDEKIIGLYNELRETAFANPEKNKDLTDRMRQAVEEKIWNILESKMHEAKSLNFEYY